MTDPILQTKLHIPPLRSSLVPRSRLTEKLNAGLEGRLTLVSSPAGYGKTTLVVEWLQTLVTEPQKGEGLRAAWLSLDENDNDPARFLIHLINALHQVDGELGAAALSMLKAPQPPPPVLVLTALINEIDLLQAPFVFVIDDYHLIQTMEIHQQLGFLVEHQPGRMHLVISTREDPPLPLARLRARGQMSEIRQEDLRFSLQECADFLQQVMGLQLSLSDIEALERRTEGWIAGLQLAALSMQGRANLSGFIESFTGSSHFVLDYLIEEVFKQQSSDVQDFLLRTSILDRLSGPLCDAVTGRADSRGVLNSLEHANLFLVPLDQSCTWYRYHHLFLELLRQRLIATETIPLKELHCLACQWFTDEGIIPEAIRHALAASDWERAAGLISASTTSLLAHGELVTLLGWCKALPEEVVLRYPPLCRDYGWALTLAGQLERAGSYLDRAEQAVQGNDELLGQVRVAQAYLARGRGAFPQAIALSRQALALIPESDHLSRGLATFTLGFSLFSAGRLIEAEPVLLEACQAARTSGNEFGRLTILGLLGDIQSNQGRLGRAAEFYREALEEAHDSPIAAPAQVSLGNLLYEWNDLEAAEDQLTQALRASQLIGSRAIEADVYGAMVRLKLAQGDFSTALETVGKLNQALQEHDFPSLRVYTAVLRTEIALAEGDLPSAAHWAQRMMDEADPKAVNVQLLIGLIQSKLLLAQGKKAEAGGILAGLYEHFTSAGLISLVIDVRLMQALAATSPVDALNLLEEALEMAQPGGFIRAFLDRGEAMRLLIADFRLQIEKKGRLAVGINPDGLMAYTTRLLAAFPKLAISPAPKSAIKNLQPATLLEPISEREREILRLLADGLSNREIAERLYITVGTAKSHVHHILEKLETESRMQAVAKAKELGLL